MVDAGHVVGSFKSTAIGRSERGCHGREPLQIAITSCALCRFVLEQCVRLRQHEREWPPDTPSHMGDRQIVRIDRAMDMCPLILGEGPFELPSARVMQELAEDIAQSTGAPARDAD
jgi:hypothetical protein